MFNTDDSTETINIILVWKDGGLDIDGFLEHPSVTVVPSLQLFAGLSHNFLPYSLIKSLGKKLFTPVGQNKHSRNQRSE